MHVETFGLRLLIPAYLKGPQVLTRTHCSQYHQNECTQNTALHKLALCLFLFDNNKQVVAIETTRNQLNRKESKMADWSTKINVRTASSNPIAKIINIIVAIVELIIGIRRSGTMSEEQDCIIIDTKTKVFWFFLKQEDVLKIGKNKISGIKVSTVKSWFIFRSTVIQILGVGDDVAYEVRVSYKEIKEKAESWIK